MTPAKAYLPAIFLYLLSASSATSLPNINAPLQPDEKDDGKEVCFKLLGCFSLEEPWHSLLRPIPAPLSPDDIKTRIYFYSRPNTEQRHEILLRPEVNLNGSPFNRSLPTAIITHGFAANGNSSWMTKLKDAYLSRVNGNVMLVDWGAGASLLNYLQVSANTRVVGKELAQLIKALRVDPRKLHLIGHSLGSHISSYAAKDTPGTARITALDPAQPAFEGFNAKVRLDESDAEFVDVVHTDARPLIPTLGFGMIGPVGHVDFYMNGGFDQPGCVIPEPSKLPKITSIGDLAKYPVEVFAQIVTCPHGRAYEYFSEALTSDDCVFWGHKASVSTVLKTVANTVSQGFITKITALSSSCSRDDCTPLGLRTKLSALRGSYLLTTKGRAPFCITEAGIPPETDTADGKSKAKPSIIKKVVSRIPL